MSALSVSMNLAEIWKYIGWLVAFYIEKWMIERENLTSESIVKKYIEMRKSRTSEKHTPRADSDGKSLSFLWKFCFSVCDRVRGSEVSG